jgi:tetrahydromethanopterin S-methyltransferase subunit B
MPADIPEDNMARGKSLQRRQAQVIPKERHSNAPVVVEQIERRISNLEKIADTVKEITEPAIASLSAYLDKKSNLQRRQQELDDKQHKRSVWILSFIVAVVFICMTALLLNQFELVKFFIQSSLAVAAGTGIAALLKGRSKGGAGQNLK